MAESSSHAGAVHAQYERWPYPSIPLVASVNHGQVWQLHLDFLRDRAGIGPAPEQPRVWIAGCGTFQPYVFGVANPAAQIIATDISQASLRTAWARCRLHGQFRTEFAPVDLNNPSTWPEGPFDFIECYGVLMNLEDPEFTLREMARRLTPEGLLRIMVYPFYSRQRVFQIQRLAKLLGLNLTDRHAPQRLRWAIAQLPDPHPLRFAFHTYHDARTDAGLVDGFLHAGDRGFTGIELGKLVDQAELEPGFFFHRPWGQPQSAAALLGLTGHRWDWILHYLDLWQRIRGNFIVVLRKKHSRGEPGCPRLHPTFTPWWRRWLGIQAPSRLHADPIGWSGTELARLRRALQGSTDKPLLCRAADDGVMLGLTERQDHGLISSLHNPPLSPLTVGPGVPRPIYAHVFAAYSSMGPAEPPMPPLATQLARWDALAMSEDTALEDGRLPFGLTPHGTATHARSEVLAYANRPRQEHVLSYSDLCFSDDVDGIDAARRWLRHLGFPTPSLEAHELRELWQLTGGATTLFVDAEPV